MSIPFTPQEIEIIRARYPEEGRAVARAIGRPVSSVSRKAVRLGVCRKGYENHGATQGRVWTEAEDQTIIRLWPDVLRRKLNAKSVAAQLGVSENSIRVRAARLGVARPTGSTEKWTEEQDEYLCEWAHLGLYALALRFKKRGWNRSRGALACRLRKLGQTLKGANDQLYSARGFANLLGMDNSTVLIWIRKGWLKAKPKSPGHHRSGDGPAEYAIQPRDARKFIVNHTAHVDLTHADKFWLVDLLAGESE